jgi:hypothetical protein
MFHGGAIWENETTENRKPPTKTFRSDDETYMGTHM